jgi:hypothetical protein
VVERVDPLDDEVSEAWQRLTDEPHVRGVEAYRINGTAWVWYVTVWAMEFVREEPLESELRSAIPRAIRGVPGVQDAAEQDREVWTIVGSPTGDTLTRAVADAVDQFVDRIRAHIESLG